MFDQPSEDPPSPKLDMYLNINGEPVPAMVTFDNGSVIKFWREAVNAKFTSYFGVSVFRSRAENLPPPLRDRTKGRRNHRKGRKA